MDASVVIAPYLEPVVRGRRIAVLGDATLSLGQALLERGARLVHVYDPSAARVAEVLAQRGVSRTLMTAPLPDGDLPVRDGAFDVVVVPDLASFVPVDAIVARARKLTAASGYAVFVSPNPDTLSDIQQNMPRGEVYAKHQLLTYYEMYDAIALQFPEVRMLGQAPFSGYVIADFAPEGDPDVVVDTSLVGREEREPRWYMALGTQQPRRLDAFTIVQVPPSLGLSGDSETIGHLRQQIASLEMLLEETRAAAAPSSTVVAATPVLDLSPDRTDALETSLREREEELRRAESRAGDNHVRAGRLENRVRDLEEELRAQRDRAFRLSNDLEEEKKLRTKAELELRMVRSRSNMPPAQDPASLVEVERLRMALSQAEARIVALGSELASEKTRLEATERELVECQDVLNDVHAAKRQVDELAAELQRAVAKKDARIAKLDALVVTLQEAAADPGLKRDLDMARQAYDDLQASFDASLASKLKEVSKLVRERDEARRSIEQTRLDMERLLASVAQERDNARSELEASLERADDLEAALEALREQLSMLQSEVRERNEQAMANAFRERDDAVERMEASQQEHARDVAGLERSLQDRGQEIRTLREVVAHHERIVRELLLRLDGVALSESGLPTDMDVHARLELVLAETARLEGALQQARWRIAELEQRARDEERSDSAKDVSALEHALLAAHSELDAMRQVLAQKAGITGQLEATVAEEPARPDREALLLDVAREEPACPELTEPTPIRLEPLESEHNAEEPHQEQTSTELTDAAPVEAQQNAVAAESAAAPAAPAEPAESTAAVAESAQSAESAEQTERTERTESVESVEPGGAGSVERLAQPAELSELAQPAEPTEPAGPAGPAEPTEPTEPTESPAEPKDLAPGGGGN